MSECNNTAVKVITHPNCFRCLLGNLLTCHQMEVSLFGVMLFVYNVGM